MNKINIGDHVRFIDATGEGVITKYDGKKTVYVLMDDGFEFPAQLSEVVVINPANSEKYEQSNLMPEPSTSTPPPTPKPALQKAIEIFETEQGEQLSLMLAFVPVDIHSFMSSDLRLYLINDSNYFIHYNIALVNDDMLESKYCDVLEPNIKILLSTIKADETNLYENIRVQAFAFKQKQYSFKPAIDVLVNVKPIKFCKLHSYRDNDFFDEKAMIFNIISNDMQEMDFVVPKNILSQKADKESPRPQKKIVPAPEPDVIDLHIEQLIDNLNGLTPFDILSYQLDKVESILKSNTKNKGKKIVFIHGKGDGVLRAEIIKRLKKYPKCSYQDASFQKYGYGATMIIFH